MKVSEKERRAHQPALDVMREQERFETTGLSRVQWWRLEGAGKVPRRIQLGANSVGWLRSEIEEWLQSRIAERDRKAA